MAMIDFTELFKTIDASHSIADLFELDAIPPINCSSDFFFVSYSHEDYKKVYKDIYQYQKEKVNVWFDRGLRPGGDWLENAEHFVSQFACKGVIIYFSKHSLRSEAVLNEIFLANSCRKPVMPIVLDKEELVEESIAKTLIRNFDLTEDQKAIINKTFTSRTLWIDGSFPIKSKVNYVQNLKDATEVLEIVDLDEDTAEVLLNSNSRVKGKMLTQVNDPYCMRVDIPLDVKYIGNATFTNMANLKEADLSSVLEIDDYAFSDAKNLKEANLSKVRYLGDSVFERCVSLEKVVFPRFQTFAEALEAYDSIDLSETFSDENGEFDEEALQESWQALQQEWMVEDDSALGEGQLRCPREEDEIPKHCGKNVFAHCDSLKEVTLENTFDDVSEGCFHDCQNLEKVVFNGPNVIGKRAFYHCVSLKTIVFADDQENYEDFSEYDETRRAAYMEKKVTEIGESAFEGCASLESFDLPRELKRIGSCAFKNASVRNENLYVNVPHGPQAFMGSTLRRIDFGPIDIADEACRGCLSLNGLRLNLGDHSIGASAFRDCSSLGEVFINAKELITSCFSHSGVTKAILDKNVQYIGEYAFSTCEKLEEMELRCEDVSIGKSAFYKTKIKHLYLSKKCHITFDPCALDECEIEHIFYDGELEDIDEGHLLLQFDFVENPRVSNAFMDEDDKWDFIKNQADLQRKANLELLPKLLGKVCFYSQKPNYDGMHWRFVGNQPEIWKKD